MSGNTCIFCAIAAGEIACIKVYEDTKFLAFLDIRPVSEGHALVVPKAHFETLDQCPADVLGQITGVACRIAPAVVEVVGAEGYNLLCNNGRSAGQLVGHVHFHVIPRRAGDGVFERWPAGHYSPGRAEEIAVKIRERI